MFQFEKRDKGILVNVGNLIMAQEQSFQVGQALKGVVHTVNIVFYQVQKGQIFKSPKSPLLNLPNGVPLQSQVHQSGQISKGIGRKGLDLVLCQVEVSSVSWDVSNGLCQVGDLLPNAENMVNVQFILCTFTESVCLCQRQQRKSNENEAELLRRQGALKAHLVSPRLQSYQQKKYPFPCVMLSFEEMVLPCDFAAKKKEKVVLFKVLCQYLLVVSRK